MITRCKRIFIESALEFTFIHNTLLVHNTSIEVVYLRQGILGVCG